MEIRRILRLGSLAAAGHGELDAPAWSICAHPLLLAVLAGHGIDPAQHPRFVRSLRERVETAGLEWADADIQHGLVRFGRIGPKAGGWVLEDYATLSIRLDVVLPQTTVTMLLSTSGLRLHQVLELPFALPDLLIRRITQDADGPVRLHFDRKVRPCSPIPEGLDATWLRVPVMPMDDVPF